MFAYDIPAGENRQINMISYEEHQFEWADKNLIEGTIENVFSTENAVLAVYNSDYSLHAGDKISLNVNGMPQELNVVGVLSKSLLQILRESPTSFVRRKHFSSFGEKRNIQLLICSLGGEQQVKM